MKIKVKIIKLDRINGTYKIVSTMKRNNTIDINDIISINSPDKFSFWDYMRN